MERSRKQIPCGEETKKKRIKVSSAKAKGRNLQKWVCEQISKLTGIPWSSNGKEDCPISSRPMGQSGTDVRLESHVKKLFPFSVECKWCESWSVPSWIEQAKTNQEKGTHWVLFCKRSRLNPVVILDAETFFELLRRDKDGLS
jgi:hypothetical protein